MSVKSAPSGGNQSNYPGGMDKCGTRAAALVGQERTVECPAGVDAALLASSPVRNRNASRRRVRNPEMWKRTQRKTNRVAGQEYVDTNGRVVSAKQMGPECKCNKKCYSRVDESCRQAIFDGFYSLANYDEQNAYLSGLIVKKEIRLHNRSSQRCTSRYEYFVRYQGEHVQVCKTAFANIHSISFKKINVICRKLNKNIMYPKDLRGQHQNRPLKISDDMKNPVRHHLQFILKPPIHKAFIRYSHNPTLNVKKMYDNYCDWLLSRSSPDLPLPPPLSKDPKCGSPKPVKPWLYNRIFNAEFRSGVHLPRQTGSSRPRKRVRSAAQTISAPLSPIADTATQRLSQPPVQSEAQLAADSSQNSALHSLQAGSSAAIAPMVQLHRHALSAAKVISPRSDSPSAVADAATQHLSQSPLQSEAQLAADSSQNSALHSLSTGSSGALTPMVQMPPLVTPGGGLVNLNRPVLVLNQTTPDLYVQCPQLVCVPLSVKCYVDHQCQPLNLHQTQHQQMTQQPEQLSQQQQQSQPIQQQQQSQPIQQQQSQPIQQQQSQLLLQQQLTQQQTLEPHQLQQLKQEQRSDQTTLFALQQQQQEKGHLLPVGIGISI